MTYQALARKWRPHHFSQVVGQEHVVRALINSITHQRMHHAYLFTGTRGVGKTTIARILAKALNCEHSDNSEPCGKCSACIDIDQGCYVDLLEIDAASRTKVEDTRELLENVQYKPSRGRFKIYLIDEVHMLSSHSFNALLKTLEEPPEHVKFLLATTDPQKIPVTVLSRCLQFNLKRMQAEQIVEQMRNILTEEQIAFEPIALEQLAIAAEGSMRDGLSLLDQAIVYNSGELSDEAVNAMLGTVARQPVAELLKVLARGEPLAVLEQIARLAELVTDYSRVIQELLRLLHQVALAQVIPEYKAMEKDSQLIAELAGLLSPEETQLYYEIAIKAQRDLPYMPTGRSGLEMAFLRMLAFRPVIPADDSASSVIPSARASTRSEKPVQSVKPVAQPADIANSRSSQNSGSANSMVATENAVAVDRPAPGELSDKPEWMSLIQAAGVGGMSRQLAENCVLVALDDKVCHLKLSSSAEHMRTKLVEQRLEQALRKHLGRQNLVLNIELSTDMGEETPAAKLERGRVERQKNAEQLIEQDENIRALKENFDGQVIPGSTQPID